MDFYERWLRFALERPRWIAVFGVLLIVASYFCYKGLGTDLLPAMDEGGFVLDYIMPPGSSLQETNRVVGHIEQMIREVPEVERLFPPHWAATGLGGGHRSQHRRHRG